MTKIRSASKSRLVFEHRSEYGFRDYVEFYRGEGDEESGGRYVIADLVELTSHQIDVLIQWLQDAKEWLEG